MPVPCRLPGPVCLAGAFERTFSLLERILYSSERMRVLCQYSSLPTGAPLAAPLTYIPPTAVPRSPSGNPTVKL